MSNHIMIVEVIVEYAAVTPTYATTQIDAGVPINFDLDLGMQALTAAAIAAMQAEDNSNKEWLIETTKVANYIKIIFYSSTIDPSVTIYEKGANVFEDSPVFADLSAIVVPILNILIP